MGSEIRYSESEQLMTDEDLEIMKAVERFCANVTVPVLHEVSTDVVDQVGTGTLFKHNGRLLLITARHIFDEISPEVLVLPSTAGNTRAIQTWFPHPPVHPRVRGEHDRAGLRLGHAHGSSPRARGTPLTR